MDGGTDAETPSPDSRERFLPAVVSGSRLKARVLAPAGSDDPVFVGWWDSELAVPCAFGYAADGAYRCLPQMPGNSPVGHVASTCDDTPIVINFRPECAEATHLHQTAEIEPACPHQGSVTEIWKLAPISAPASYYDGSPAFCDGPREPPAMGTFASASELVEPSRFVAGTLRIMEDGDELGMQVLESEDGARLLTEPFDPRYGRCGQGPMRDEARCAPTRTAFASRDLFVDDACEEPVVGLGADDPCDGRHQVVAITQDATATSPMRLNFGVVGEALSGTVHRKSGEACAAVPVEEALGANVQRLHRIAPIELLPLSSATRGTWPLKTVYLTRADGVLLHPGAFTRSSSWTEKAYFEDESGTRCVPVATPSGTYKCMPVGAVAIAPDLLYADAECTQRIGSIYPGSLPPNGTPTVLFEREPEACASYNSISSVRSVFEAGERHDGPVYASDGEVCYEWGAGESYRVGRSVLADLPELTLSLR